ncbi:uncharacterized protein [Macrobrachium rosenbergii]|uniref:uncharacterized protein isoform X2 n=1 Tax=Macrobrachium rosenbergii TaxID=79674 RepID=UPI0034D45BD4
MKVLKMALGQYCSRCYARKRGTMRNLEALGVFLVVAVTVFIVYQYTAARSHMVSSVLESQTQKETYSTWPTFNIKLIHSRDWYIENCFNGQFSEDLEDVFRNLIPTWSETENDECKNLYDKFVALYEVHERYSGKLTLPAPFLKRVSRWLGGDKTLLEQVHQQHLIHIFHPLTAEHTVYNPVRSKRPMPTKDTNIYEWVNKLSAETEKDCDFCNFMNMTAVDEFGRHITKDTARVSNTFKVEAWHSMVITKQHHPTNMSKEVVVNLLKESMSWVYEVSQKDPQYIYTNIAWDILHHAGASQIHPHFHMMMAPDHYYGSFELLRSAAQRYYDINKENYFNTLIEIHAALGLVVEYGDAVAIATLSGKADLEVMFLSDFPGESLYRLIYFAFNAYHDTFSQLCKSLVGAWPALGMSKEASVGRIPAIVRLISRGDCTSLRTDFSSYEIFQIVYRIHDPWQVVNAIRRSIAKYDN